MSDSTTNEVHNLLQKKHSKDNHASFKCLLYTTITPMFNVHRVCSLFGERKMNKYERSTITQHNY